MKVLFFLTFVLLVIRIKAVEDVEDVEDDSDIEEGDGSPKQLGMRCGRNNPCAEGLNCIRAPLRKKCFPVECAVEAAKAAFEQDNFDLGTYGEQMMNKAGITMESKMFRKFPGAQHMDLFDTNDGDMTTFMETVRTNPPPVNQIAKNFEECTKNTVDGQTIYYGASWGIGALGTYNGDVYWAQGTNDTAQLATLNNCFGIVLGYDLGVAGLLGFAFTGTAADLQSGCKQMFPIASFPPFSLEIGFIDCDNPTFVIELTAGLDASAGLPGYTSCTTTAL